MIIFILINILTFFKFITYNLVVSNEFIKLIENCLLEGNKYILKISGGKNNSKEGINKGFEVKLLFFIIIINFSIFN